MLLHIVTVVAYNDQIWPPQGPSILPRKALVELKYRSTDGWPLSVTWEIHDSTGDSGHLSILSAAVSSD